LEKTKRNVEVEVNRTEYQCATVFAKWNGTHKCDAAVRREEDRRREEGDREKGEGLGVCARQRMSRSGLRCVEGSHRE
jgi:hypothetical protein